MAGAEVMLMSPEDAPFALPTTKALRDEIAQLKAKVTDLESKDSASDLWTAKLLARTADAEEEAKDNFRILSHELKDHSDSIDEIDARIVQIIQKPKAPPQGSKTIARIAKIDEILKARGATTLKELERILKIRPQEMSRLLRRLDQRRYEVFLRNENKQEKVIRLRRTC